MPKSTVKKIGVRAASRRTLQFGMVSVGVAIAPTTDTAARVSAKLVEAGTLTPVKQQYVNAEGKVVKPIKAYPHGDQLVEIDPAAIEALDDSSTIALVANVDHVPGEFVERTNLCWPADETQNAAYSLVAGYLRDSGRAMIGRFVANGTTKVLAISWSAEYGALIAQQLVFHGQVRWANVETVREGVAEIPAPEPQMAEMAAAVFNAIPAEFDYSSVTDEYGDRLEQAIADRAAGKQLSTKTLDNPTAPEADSLMAALTATLNAAKPAEAPATATA